MRIQVISLNKKIPPNSSVAVCSLINSPRSLDEFDVNVIDLRTTDLWRYRGNSYSSINQINDFKSISNMILRKSSSKVLIVLPQNVNFLFRYSYDKYHESKPLKDMLGTLHKEILIALFPSGMVCPTLQFENTRTTINSITYVADFYFDTREHIITSSHLSKKATTVEIQHNSLYATTLNVLQSEAELFGFLNYIFPSDDKETAPSWIKDFFFANDEEQMNVVTQCEAKIAAAKEEIENANAILKQNLQYKSILYTNGAELVQVVFKILEQLLSCNLSEFVDEGKEDFRIVKENCTFIGEIKGVTSNVKNEHISQVDLHYQSYLDKLNEEGKTEKVNQILIINPFRTKPLNERDPINEHQIKLAERNGCLIIETVTLLKMFEKFVLGQVSSERCIDIFSQTTGLLSEQLFCADDEISLDSYKI